MKKRDYVLTGKTYKIPISAEEKIYVTINSFAEDPSRPFEVFLNSHSTAHTAELNALTLTLSALCRLGNIDFIIEDFKKIGNPAGGVWWNPGRSNKGIYVRSIPHAIALALEMYIQDSVKTTKIEPEPEKTPVQPVEPPKGAFCPKCQQPTLVKRAGCEICENPECTYVGSCG